MLNFSTGVYNTDINIVNGLKIAFPAPLREQLPHAVDNPVDLWITPTITADPRWFFDSIQPANSAGFPSPVIHSLFITCDQGGGLFVFPRFGRDGCG